jgi:UDP-N-acetylglucosamine pyrophosphorylase
MIKVASDSDRVLIAKVREAAQEHVLQFWEQLNQTEQAALLAQLHSLNLLLMKDLVARYLKGTQEVMEARLLTAAPLLRVATSEEELVREREVRGAGEEALRKGQVAILTAAGDTGEESCPKGLFQVGPVSQKTLLCLHAERIRRSRRGTGPRLPGSWRRAAPLTMRPWRTSRSRSTSGSTAGT